MANSLVLGVPKGRILEEFLPILDRAGITPEAAFFDSASRKLRFSTDAPHLDIVRVRSFDVATFVAFGAVALGVAGSDVLTEFPSDNIYVPADLGIGKCRLSVAATKELDEDISRWSHIRIATKYPNTTRSFFEARGIQAECIKLNGAMELAPNLGLCRRIVDLVSTGSTLKANGLVEVEKIADVSSHLIVNRTALKTQTSAMTDIIERLKEAM